MRLLNTDFFAADMRANQRELRKANRDIESDRRGLERREKELVSHMKKGKRGSIRKHSHHDSFQEAEIKKLAKQGQKDACALLAKQLVQLRNQKQKSYGMGARLSGIQAQNRYESSLMILL